MVEVSDSRDQKGGAMSKLKRIREERGMTQASLSDKSGVSKRLIQAYEQGYKDINKAQVLTVVRLAKALGCYVTDLIEEVE